MTRYFTALGVYRQNIKAFFNFKTKNNAGIVSAKSNDSGINRNRDLGN